MGVRFALIVTCAALLGAACATTPAVVTPSPSAIARPSASGAASLPTVDQERTIVDALARRGVRVTAVAPTKFDWLFGAAAPHSALFNATVDGASAWADIHFLSTPLKDLSACSETPPARETMFTVKVNGHVEASGGGSVTGSLGAATPMYFLSDDRYFVMTPHAGLRDAIATALGLSTPPCITMSTPPAAVAECHPTVAQMAPPAEALEFFANGSSTPDAARQQLKTANWYGNEAMWVVLPPNGEIVGRLDDKIPPYRVKRGFVDYEARQLDGAGVVAKSRIGASYGDIGFAAGGPSFPTMGCWEVTYTLDGTYPLTFVLRVR